MILVTLGTQKFQMNRLIKAVDAIAETLKEEVFVQTGNSSYTPCNCKHQAFVDKDEFKQMIENCSLLITHSGVGSIMTGIRAKKPIIVVPRMKLYKEHVDDHQAEIAQAFSEKGCVLCCTDLSKLGEVIQQAGSYSFQPYVEPEGKVEDIILSYIGGIHESRNHYNK